MAWTIAVDDTFARADTSTGAAGSTTGVGNGWIDNAGGTWHLASGKLAGGTSDASGYLSKYLRRPTGEAAVASRITAAFTGSFTGEVGLVLRAQAGGDCYLAQLTPVARGGVQMLLYAVVGGSPALLTSGALSTALVAGHQYLADLQASGASPTALSLTITDTTASAVVGTLTASNSASSIQAAGVPAMVIWSNDGTAVTNTYSEVATYTQSTGAAITLSPTSVTAGTTGQAIAVTGSGTSLSSTTFTLSGGLGAFLSAQSVTSATAATLTLSPGLPGNGPLTVTNSAGGTATLAVTPPALGALKLGFVGDSITAGTNGDPVSAMAAALGVQGYTVTAVNRGVSGSSTADWLPGGSTLPAAISAFTSAGVSIVQVMLGTNDGRTPNNLTAAQTAANLRLIVAALRTAGFQVLLHKPLWMLPNANAAAALAAGSGAVWPNDANDRTRDAWRLLVPACDGVNVFAGDTGFHEFTTLNNVAVLDALGIHPKDGANNTLLGQYWAVAFLHRYGAQRAAW